MNNSKSCYNELEENEKLIIEIKQEIQFEKWLHILGEILRVNNNEYVVNVKDKSFILNILHKDILQITTEIKTEDQKKFAKYLKRVLRKATFCINCGFCNTTCEKKCYKDKQCNFNKCTHCLSCLDIDYGCLRYSSIKSS